MSYRKLTDDEIYRLPVQTRWVERARAITTFINEVYGREARSLLIINDGDTFGGLDIEDVRVFANVWTKEEQGKKHSWEFGTPNEEWQEILPDTMLDFWQQEFAKEPTLEEDLIAAASDTMRLEIIKEYLKDNQVYEQYELDPEDTDVIILADLGTTEYPELYVREED